MDAVTWAQIQSLLRIGRRPEDIADHLGVPIAWVQRPSPPKPPRRQR